MTRTARISALATYPVKSGAGIAHDSLTFTSIGPAFDRAWMVVDPTGDFVTQRTLGSMAQLGVAVSDEGLTLTHPAMECALTLPIKAGSVSVPVRVWRHRGPAIDTGADAAAWLSEAFARPLRLVRIAPDHGRLTNPDFAPAGTPVSFADGYPILVTSTASLADLNHRMTTAIGMERFRPNIVLDGVEPYEEELMNGLVADGQTFLRGKLCVRCKITTLDPASGVVTGVEPLRTLAGYKYDEALGGVIFGANFASSTATLRVGQTVEII